MANSSNPVVGVIVDIVGSRNLANRAQAQDEIMKAFRTIEAETSPLEPLHPTVGDEFQAVFPTTPHAVLATILAPLLLPEGVDVRFGLGYGHVTEIKEGASASIQDGTAWWNAREAIEKAHQRQSVGNLSARTWIVGDPADSLLNAYFVLKDHTVSRMKKRERRLASALFLGRTQKEMAATEKLSQASVSETLHRSGAISLRDSFELIAVDSGDQK